MVEEQGAHGTKGLPLPQLLGENAQRDEDDRLKAMLSESVSQNENCASEFVSQAHVSSSIEMLMG